jgi:hypothetical protein
MHSCVKPNLLLFVLSAALATFAPVSSHSQAPNPVGIPSSVEAQLYADVERARKEGAVIPNEVIEEMVWKIRRGEKRAKEVQEEVGGDIADLLSADLWAKAATPRSRTVGTQGIPFPDSSKMEWEPLPVSKSSPQSAARPRVAPTATPYPIPPKRCTRDETVKNVVAGNGEKSNVRLDRLFVPEEYVPLDTQEAFGLKVDVVSYGPNSGASVEQQLAIYQVPCLPYRVRITDAAEYFDSGANAMKNYDSDYDGKGEFDPVVFQKLYPGKRPPPVRKPRIEKRR